MPAGQLWLIWCSCVLYWGGPLRWWGVVRTNQCEYWYRGETSQPQWRIISVSYHPTHLLSSLQINYLQKLYSTTFSQCSESYFWNSIEAILRIFRIIWRISEYLLSLLIFEWEMADIRISARSHTEIPPSVLWGQSVKIVLLKLSKHHLLSPLCCSCQVSDVKREQLDGFFSQFLLSASGVGGGGGPSQTGVLGGGVLNRARPGLVNRRGMICYDSWYTFGSLSPV